MPNPNAQTPGGSATRHFVTYVLAGVLGGWAAKKGLPVPPEVAGETAAWLVDLVLGGAVAAGAGALWRKVTG